MANQAKEVLVSLVKQLSIVGSALMPKQANQSVLLRRLSPSVSYRNRKVTTHFGVTVYVHFNIHWSTFKAVSELLKPPSKPLILKKKRKEILEKNLICHLIWVKIKNIP